MTKKIIIPTIFILFCLISHAAIGMEQPYSQLQLNQPKKQLPIIYGEVCIATQKPLNPHSMFNFVHESVYYANKWERDYLNKAGIEVSLYDPCIPIEIKFDSLDINEWVNLGRKQNEDYLFLRRPIMPVKYFLNYSTNSVLEIILYGQQAKFRCNKNPLIDNKEFHEQFEKRMKIFFEKPSSWAHMGQNARVELIPADIVIITPYAPDDVTITRLPNGVTNTVTQRHWTYTHGSKGCPNEVELSKIAAVRKIQPYGNSFHQLVMHRQTGNTLRIPKPRPKSLREDEYGRHGSECVLL